MKTRPASRAKAAPQSPAARKLTCPAPASNAPAPPAFAAVFARLRAILKPYAARLTVSADAPDYYCLALDYSPRFQKGFPVAWVQISTAYVSYHFMPVYMFPKLRDGLSPKLRARMQGKSCFNFKQLDEPLFAELARLTADGFAAARQSGTAA